jgi:hypothetical protein
MFELIPRIVLPVILGAAWRLRHRTLEASTVRLHVNRAFVTAVAARAMLEGVRSGSAAVAIVAAVLADTLAALLLWDLTRLAFMGPGRRGDRIFQLVACLIATLAVWAGSPGAAPFFLWLALTRHPWLMCWTRATAAPRCSRSPSPWRGDSGPTPCVTFPRASPTRAPRVDVAQCVRRRGAFGAMRAFGHSRPIPRSASVA